MSKYTDFLRDKDVLNALVGRYNDNKLKFVSDVLEAFEKLELEAVKNRVCEWKIETDEFANNYETGCDNIFAITEDTLEDNEFYYCPYCGGKIELKSEVE